MKSNWNFFCNFHYSVSGYAPTSIILSLFAVLLKVKFYSNSLLIENFIRWKVLIGLSKRFIPDGCCNYTKQLNEIKINPKSPRYYSLNETNIFGSIHQMIGPYAFDHCSELQDIDTSECCELKEIDECSFSNAQ